MTKEEILQLIRQGESFRLEAKKAEKEVPVSVWESYSAFCNTDGGIILLGVSEDKKTKELYVSGVEDSGKIIQSFWNQINNKQKVSDNLLFNRQVYALSIEDKDIVVIEVPRADRHYKPVFINDNLFAGTYRRNADGDYHCQREEVKAMLRDQADITLDNTIVENVDWQELDKDTIYRFRMRFRNLKPDHVWNTLDDVEFLLKVGALKRSSIVSAVHPTLAGILMFGTEMLITNEYPNYFLDYREIEDGNRYTDRVFSASGDWSGNLFDFYFKIVDRLIAGLKVPFQLRNGLDRIDETPARSALREALANALIHADYNGRRGIVIEKHKDRVVISNPGTLRITLDEALEGGISDPRNAILFKMFVLVDIGERIGSGLQNLRYVWEQLGQEQPVLRESFSPDRMRLEIPLDESITNPVTNPVSNPVTNPVSNPVTNPVSNPVTNRFDGHNLSERQEAVLCYCREAHSSREILSYLGVSYQSKNIKQYVSDLVEYGLLIPLIPDKPNHPGQKYVSVG
ncbi:RNA-binding domain-containing protein [Parabacteroides massiliensis]|uniref:RNA-binding domain-containing protein n=1 Tax=Parabacteroides massiliensis TaxID=1750560 RepID=UPI00096A3AC3|nr:RNA-binding domain-containing protein [Parabacteroides massiliensis]